MSMKAKPEQPTSEEMAQFREELDRKLQRLVGESLEAWSSCENVACRRARRCASEKRECIAKWQASLPPLSPEESEQRMNAFRRDLKARIAGLPIGEAENEPKRSKPPATDANCTGVGESQEKTAAQVLTEPQLSPEKQARIDKAWNDYVASQGKEDRAREPGPRITLL
jgi:hypothetical protein